MLVVCHSGGIESKHLLFGCNAKQEMFGIIDWGIHVADFSSYFFMVNQRKSQEPRLDYQELGVEPWSYMFQEDAPSPLIWARFINH